MSMPIAEGSGGPGARSRAPGKRSKATPSPRETPGGHEAVLRAVGFAAEQLLRASAWEHVIQEVLARLGEAADVSRVYIFQNHVRDDGELVMTKSHEWVAPGIEPTIHVSYNQIWPYSEGYERYAKVLSAGGVIEGLARDFPENERSDMRLEGIRSTAVVPVHVGDEWWGMLGLDECESERPWHPLEIEALKVAANTLGTSIKHQQAETRYRTLVEQIPAIVYVAGYGQSGDWIYISPQIESVLGYTPDEWRAHPQPFAAHVHPADRDRVNEDEARCDATGEPLRSEYRLFTKAGGIVWISDQAVLVRGHGGMPMYWQGVMYDVTEHRRTEKQLEEAQTNYQALVEHIPAIVYRVPAEHAGPYTYISPQVESILGYTPEEWIADRGLWQRLLHEEDRERVLRNCSAAERTGEPFDVEYRLVGHGDRLVWVRDEAVLINDVESGERFWHGVMLDITERKRAEEQATFLAYHDKLTGLPNRTMFEELLNLGLARALRHDLAVAVLALDLDNFKLVNDSLGHEAGDELLRLVAERLREANRETDLVARQGGDEFLLLLADLDLGDRESLTTVDSDPRYVAETVAGRVHEALRMPIVVSGTEVFVTASIGISVFPLDAKDAGGVLRNADAAMYRSKRSGPGGSGIFAVDTSDSLRRLSFTTRLRKAVDRSDWILHYQPVVDLQAGTMIGVEALLRWQDPENGIIPPDEFIPLAEEIGLLERIGDWALGELCRQSAIWRNEGLDLEIGFNLSPRQLWQPGLAEKIKRSLRSVGLDSRRVLIEITESTAMAKPFRTQRILEGLHGDGVRLAIDDFGTGYSSLSRLKDLPVDVLKIDRSFINDLPDDPDASSMVKTMIQMASNLGMTPLAEGIETRAQWQFLVENGCRQGQGFFFSRPVPADQIRARYPAAGALGDTG